MVLQSTTLAGGFLQPNRSVFGSNGNYNGFAQKGSSNSATDEGPVMFCKGYQRGFCTYPQDHMGKLNGESRFLRHICAKCWLMNKKKCPHPESSPDCPFRSSEHQ